MTKCSQGSTDKSNLMLPNKNKGAILSVPEGLEARIRGNGQSQHGQTEAEILSATKTSPWWRQRFISFWQGAKTMSNQVGLLLNRLLSCLPLSVTSFLDKLYRWAKAQILEVSSFSRSVAKYYIKGARIQHFQGDWALIKWMKAEWDRDNSQEDTSDPSQYDDWLPQSQQVRSSPLMALQRLRLNACDALAHGSRCAWIWTRSGAEYLRGRRAEGAAACSADAVRGEPARRPAQSRDRVGSGLRASGPAAAARNAASRGRSRSSEGEDRRVADSFEAGETGRGGRRGSMGCGGGCRDSFEEGGREAVGVDGRA